MNPKITLSVTALAAALVFAPGLASADPYYRPAYDRGGYDRGGDGRGYDRGPGRHERQMGRVLEVIPIEEFVQHPVNDRECWGGGRRHGGRSDSPVGTIAGGILGGVAGNQFGEGSGRTAMTIAGTVLGAAIGNDVSREESYAYDEPRCREVTRYEERREVVGYRVKYIYRGEVGWTRTDQDPGEYVLVDRPHRHGRW